MLLWYIGGGGVLFVPSEVMQSLWCLRYTIDMWCPLCPLNLKLEEKPTPDVSTDDYILGQKYVL